MTDKVTVKGRGSLSCIISVRFRVRIRVMGVGVGLRGGGRVFVHTHACKEGLSGMRFNEGGRDLAESERVVKRCSTQCHMLHTLASQFGLHHFRRKWVPLPHPVMCVCPLNNQTQYLELYELPT